MAAREWQSGGRARGPWEPPAVGLSFRCEMRVLWRFDVLRVFGGRVAGSEDLFRAVDPGFRIDFYERCPVEYLSLQSLTSKRQLVNEIFNFKIYLFNYSKNRSLCHIHPNFCHPPSSHSSSKCSSAELIQTRTQELRGQSIALVSQNKVISHLFLPFLPGIVSVF